MTFEKGHKINLGKKNASLLRKPRYTELYGDYPTLNDMQLEYIKLAADPRNKLTKITNQDIADLLGVSLKTVKNYRVNPTIRKAIIDEIMMKSSDGLGDIIENMRKMALGEGKYSEIGITDQLKANKDWLNIHDMYGEDKRTKKGKPAIESVIDKELEELEREFKADPEGAKV